MQAQLENDSTTKADHREHGKNKAGSSRPGKAREHVNPNVFVICSQFIDSSSFLICSMVTAVICIIHKQNTEEKAAPDQIEDQEGNTTDQD